MKRLVIQATGMLLGISVALHATHATAQSSNNINAGLQFDFSLPGARSQGMGGAFVALADDATATLANPAGLAILSKPEVAIEGRGWNFANISPDRGMAFGAPSGVGFDVVANIQDREFKDSSGALAFVSFVYPYGRLRVAGYRHQLAKYKATVGSSGPFLRTSDFRVDSAGQIDRLQPFSGNLQMNIVDYGGSLAYQVSEGLSLGLSAGIFKFDMTAGTHVFGYSGSPDQPRSSLVAAGQRFGPPLTTAANEDLVLDDSGSDTTAAVIAGALWKAKRWSAAAAFRQGPKFHYETISTAGPVNGAFRPGTIVDQETVRLAVPDVLDFGATYRPNDNLVVTFEFDRVLYSQLSEETAEVFGVEEVAPAVGRLIREHLKFPDVNQVRFGAEYAWVRGNKTFLFRGGSWFDPDHRMRFDSEGLSTGQIDSIKRLAVLFRPGSDAVHYSPGFGIAFTRFQIDASVDVSKFINTYALSSVWRF